MIYEPLRVFTPVSAVSFLLALGSTAYAMITNDRLQIPNSAVLLFVVGVLILLLGLIAEQIAVLQVASDSDLTKE